MLVIMLIEKNIVVNRDNQILLNKLVDISHGKWVSTCIMIIVLMITLIAICGA